MDITPAELDVVAKRCCFVYGDEREVAGTARRGTALGCAGRGSTLRVEHAILSPDVSGGLRVPGQGVGSVGAHLARSWQGGRPRSASPTSTPRGAARGSPRSASTVVPPDDDIDVECDVFAPCALGGILNDGDHPAARVPGRLRRRQQPARRAVDGDLLDDRGILYATDYVVNAGGVITGSSSRTSAGTRTSSSVRPGGIRRHAARRSTATADEAGITPAAAAERLAERRLSRAS